MGDRRRRRRARIALRRRSARPGAAALVVVTALGLGAGWATVPSFATPAGTPVQDGASCRPLDVWLTGPLLPGQLVSVAVDCPLVRADRTYVGAISTAPAPFPESYPLEDGAVGFSGIVLPDTFETERHHRVVLAEVGGEEIGSVHLWVNAAGEHQLVDPPVEAAERTGWRQALRDTGLVDGRADGAAKLAAVGLAAAALVWRRRPGSPSRRPARTDA